MVSAVMFRENMLLRISIGSIIYTNTGLRSSCIGSMATDNPQHLGIDNADWLVH